MVMKSHEKTWNLKIHFPVLDKSWILGENGRSHGKAMEFHIFGPKISWCLKTGKIPLVTEQKYASKRLGFAFLSHRKLKLVMKKSLNLSPNFCINPVKLTCVSYLNFFQC